MSSLGKINDSAKEKARRIYRGEKKIDYDKQPIVDAVFLEDSGFEIKESIPFTTGKRQFYFSTDEKFYFSPLEKNGKFKIYPCNIVKNVGITEAVGSKVGDAVLGAALFGTAGAVVGGSTAGQGNIVIRIETIIEEEPFLYCPISAAPISKASKMYQEMVKTADAVIYRFQRVIEKEVSVTTTASTIGNNSFMEQLNQLVEMKKQGFLTDEEFNQAKIKLLQ